MMSRFYRPAVGFTVPGLPLAALTLAVLAATGCSVQAPDELSEGDDIELALASEVEEERRAVSFNSFNVSANFNPANGQLIVAGQLPRAASVRIEDGGSNRLLGVVQAVSPFAVTTRGDDDDDRRITAAGIAPWQLVLNQSQLAQLQLSTVPCTLRLQTPQGTVLVPVQSVVSPGQSLNCANGLTGQAQTQAVAPTITRATWNAQTGSLIIAGTGAIPRQTVTFMDARTGQIIGLDEANATGAFRLRLTGVANPPCDIRVVADSRTVSSPISGTPLQCALPGTILTTTNLAPNAIITTPSAESIVVPGTTVSFDVVGIDPDNNVPLTYTWDFDGAGPRSNVRNPVMQFNSPGVYRVRATVTDSLGATDLTPDTRTIIVQASLPGPIGGTGTSPLPVPNGQILSPAASTTIGVGQAVTFSAIGSSSNGLGLTYVWNFGGGAANVAQQNPGPVIFTKPGTYTVTMTAVDALGLSDPTPETRIINVLAGVGAGGIGTTTLPPNGEITQPLNDTATYQVGQSIVFSAVGADPDGNLPISYLWDFAGAAPPSAHQTTSVVFNQPGSYRVTLYVFDSLGMADPTPAVRTINIQGVGTGTGTGQTGVSSFAPESTILSPSQDVQITLGQSVTFTGTGSDVTAGSSLIYSWDFDGGATNTMVQNPGAITFSKAGSYRVRLAARNSTGRVDLTPAERIVTVTDPFQQAAAPSGQIITPAADQTIQAGQAIQFAATGVSPTGATGLTYEWDFGTAAPKTLTQNPGTITFSQPGTYLVRLRVKDALGNADPTPEIRRITVAGVGTGNLAPEAVISAPATDLTINMGDGLNLMGAGVDPEGEQVTYLWSVAGGSSGFGGATIPSPTQSNAGMVTFSQPGTYEVKLAVTDNRGVVDPVPEVRIVTVRDMSAANPAPNGQILSPTFGAVTSITVGQAVTFSGTSTDTNSTFGAAYYWDFDGAAADSTVQNPGSVTFSRPGTYTVALRVMDDRGAVDLMPDTRTIIVRPTGIQSPIAPQGNIIAPSGDQQIGLGQSLSFSATGTDGDNNVPLSFRWNFDGAAPASNAQDAGSVTFTKPGTYNVSMTVTDSTGVSSTVPATRRITVLGSGVGSGTGTGTTTFNAPNGTILSPASFSTVQVGQSVTFLATGTDPSGSTTLNYSWNFGGSGVQPTSQQNPTVMFSVPGSYTVTLYVSNQFGVSDPTPETRIINVGVTGSQVSGVVPDGMIMVPATNQIITAGDTVHFMGQVMSATTVGQTLRYVWNFMGAANNLTELSPGDVVFNTPGTYQVSFTVMDALGQADPTPATRTITVNPKF